MRYEFRSHWASQVEAESWPEREREEIPESESLDDDVAISIFNFQ